MAAHVLRLPRLTLKAGRKAGSPRDGRADRDKTQKSKCPKFEISKIANCKIENLENFHRNFFREIDRARSQSCSQDQPQDFYFFAPSFAMCEVHI
jgi:hypothetical protein